MDKDETPKILSQYIELFIECCFEKTKIKIES